MNQNQNAATIATSILIKRRNDEKAKKEADKQQAAADVQKATPQAISRPQSINTIALRQNWYQGITVPFLKKQAARQDAKNKGMQKKAMNHRRIK